MSISNIEEYVESKNNWNSVFGQPRLSLLNAKDRKAIAQHIDGDLSPENLTCDGEADPRWVRQRHAFLCQCARELMSIDPTVRFYEFE